MASGAASMANAPHDDALIELHIRHLPGGLFTDRVFGVSVPALKVRDILRFEARTAASTCGTTVTSPIILLASGTGFAPIKAIVEHMIHTGNVRPVVLYWGGRRPSDLYLDELACGWAAQHPQWFRYVPVVSDALPEDAWDGRTGFVHRAVMQDLPDLSGYQVYACGAPVVVDSARVDFTTQCNLPEADFLLTASSSLLRLMPWRLRRKQIETKRTSFPCQSTPGSRFLWPPGSSRSRQVLVRFTR